MDLTDKQWAVLEPLIPSLRRYKVSFCRVNVLLRGAL
jgi:hypothetical protein